MLSVARNVQCAVVCICIKMIKFRIQRARRIQKKGDSKRKRFREKEGEWERERGREKEGERKRESGREKEGE